MNRVKRVTIERTKNVGVVVEIPDARMPVSSENPLLAQPSKGKPKLKILNRQDLVDSGRTKIWPEHYNSRPDTRAITLDSSETDSHGEVIQACRAMTPHRRGVDKPLCVLIRSIPNVGKSTLVNGMIGEKSAKAGNEPGTIKAEQRFFLADDFWLYDTPGTLWPKIIIGEGGYNLAAGGVVRCNVLDEEKVTFELSDYLRRHYLPALRERYQVDKNPSDRWDDNSWLEQTAKRRSAVLSGGRVNYQEVAEDILTNFREGKIGRITLGTPSRWGTWLKKARQKETEPKAVRKARKAERKGQKSSKDM